MASRNPKDDAAASAISDIERTLTALRSRIDSGESTAGPVPIVSSNEEPTEEESQPTTSARSAPAIDPETESQIKEYDTLGAHIEMEAQRNRIREADAQLHNMLRQRPQPVKPSTGAFGGYYEASFLDPTSSRPVDTEAAIREASARQSDPASSSPTGRQPEYNPQAQEWDPHGEGRASAEKQGGDEQGNWGQSFDPEAEAFRPSEEQDGKAEGRTVN